MYDYTRAWRNCDDAGHTRHTHTHRHTHIHKHTQTHTQHARYPQGFPISRESWCEHLRFLYSSKRNCLLRCSYCIHENSIARILREEMDGTLSHRINFLVILEESIWQGWEVFFYNDLIMTLYVQFLVMITNYLSKVIILTLILLLSWKIVTLLSIGHYEKMKVTVTYYL